MKFKPIVFALGLLLTGCSRHDAKLADQVAGTWMSAHTVWTLSPDGSFHSHLAGTNAGIIKEAVYDGTWSVQDGFLVTTITQRSSQNLTNLASIGQVDHQKIVRLDSTRLVLSDGLTNTYTRK